MFAIPNGGHRHIAVATKLKREGVKSGVPDVCLPVPRRSYHGLFIEMKFNKNKPSAKQKDWIEALSEQGYFVRVCYSWQEASECIVDYLKL